ncbi:MAG TPA: hypothetical protein VJ741_09660 [Solirubrobacteraceae bacterium]|nr:hypothetical protein [Solirubrobacteraceae bacterium]
MPTHLPASGAHVLWVVAVVAATNIAVRTWTGVHPDSAFAKALAFAF